MHVSNYPSNSAGSQLLPDDILVVSAVDEGIHLAALVAAEQPTALDARTEEEVAGFGHKKLLRTLTSFRVQLVAFA